MSRTDELRQKNENKKRETENVSDNLKILSDDAKRMSQIFDNAGIVINDLDKEFSEKTGIFNLKDLTLLFTATGLLCAKWYIMSQKMPLDFDFKYEPKPKDERLNHKAGDKLADEKLKKDKKYGQLKDENDRSSNGYRTVNQIIFRPVPYDAISKIAPNSSLLSGIIGLENLSGRNHHSYTMGHDPVLGWVFGPINILTRSITLKNPTLSTYSVLEDGNKIITAPPSSIFAEIAHAIESISEDNARLPAAVFKQGLHFYSDKYCKQGLPIPFLSPKRQQELIEKGWNSVELENAIKKFAQKSAKLAGTVALQFGISFLINLLIRAIHLMLYNESKDGDLRLYEVRTRKILLTSNVIASSSNLIYSTAKGVSAGIAAQNPALGISEGAKSLDIGGLIETVHRLVSDIKFINAVKREYILNNFENMIIGDEDEYFFAKENSVWQ